MPHFASKLQKWLHNTRISHYCYLIHSLESQSSTVQLIKSLSLPFVSYLMLINQIWCITKGTNSLESRTKFPFPNNCWLKKYVGFMQINTLIAQTERLILILFFLTSSVFLRRNFVQLGVSRFVFILRKIRLIQCTMLLLYLWLKTTRQKYRFFKIVGKNLLWPFSKPSRSRSSHTNSEEKEEQKKENREKIGYN